jgi:hypothetical protein
LKKAAFLLLGFISYYHARWVQPIAVPKKPFYIPSGVALMAIKKIVNGKDFFFFVRLDLTPYPSPNRRGE